MVAGTGLWSPNGIASGTSPETSRTVIRESLAAVRSHLGMEVAFIGRFAEGRRWFEYVDADDSFCPISPGGSDPLEESYCARVVDGRIPELIPDAAREPGVADLDATLALPVGAHLSVALRDPEDRVFGTLCCFSRQPDPDLRERDLAVLRLVAGVVQTHVHSLLDHEEATSWAFHRISDVLEQGGPAIALQPVVDLTRDRVCGFEALARFPHGTWSPVRWFAEAEMLGLGPELEASAIRAALRLLPQLPGDTTLSVNASASALCAGDVIVSMVTDVPGQRVVVELTEHQRVWGSSLLAERLGRLRAAGVRIAVDDAGSGYAGLEHIVHLRPDVLKLDRVLIDGIAGHPGRQAMCEAMVGFSRRTGATLVAEGVETEEDLAVLRDLGVTHAQGYLLGRPTIWT